MFGVGLWETLIVVLFLLGLVFLLRSLLRR